MGVIPASINTLSSQYPRRDVKDPAKYKYVDTVMKGLQGTPCCVQISHALNLCGIPVPTRSYRRDPNLKLKINGRTAATCSPPTSWKTSSRRAMANPKPQTAI